MDERTPCPPGKAALRVISIPLLTDLICQHLESWHIANVLFVSRAFHEAFLEYRWRTLSSLQTDQDRPTSVFPLRPSADVESALVRYGAGFARHVVLPHCRNELGQVLTQEDVHCGQLRTLIQLGHKRARTGGHWMHWDGMEDDYFYKECEFDGQVETWTLCQRILTLAEQSNITLRKLHLEGFANDVDTPLPFIIGLTRLLPTMKNLEDLTIGPMPTEDIINVVLHLPRNIQELSLRRWWPSTFRFRAALDFETQWRQYQDRLGTEHPVPPLSLRSLIESLETKARLTRLSLTNMGSTPPWVLHEILRHCPNLISFRVPFLDESGVSELIEVLQKTRIEQLDFSGQRMSDRFIAHILDCLLPANRKGHQQSPPRGLRSLTLTDQLDFEHGKRSLALHHPSLERISIVRCGVCFDSQSVLQLLEKCPQLDTLLTIDSVPDSTAIDQSRMLAAFLRNPNVPTVDCSQFLFGGETLNKDDGQVEEDADVTLDQMSMPQETLLLPRIRLSWPCVQTLRVLSLDLKIDSEVGAERLPFYFTAIYKRFGQLEALEDLALDCNAVFAEFDPWAGYDNQNKKRSDPQDSGAGVQFGVVGVFAETGTLSYGPTQAAEASEINETPQQKNWPRRDRMDAGALATTRVVSRSCDR